MAEAQYSSSHSACDEDSISPMKEAILSEVTVSGLTGTERMKDSPIAFSVVSPKVVHQQMGTNIVDLLARQPGLAQISTGAGISKPVIRGLGYNRVVVVEQGIRQEGQQWGDEHGLEVDAEGVHSVEILKGPASLMYGSDAIAGVMILHPEHPLALNTSQVKVGGEYQSNNGAYTYHVGTAGNRDGFLWNWHFNDKAAHCYRNAHDGYVPGSGYKERDVQGLLGISRDWGHSWLRFSHVDFRPGITEGEREASTGALLWEDGASPLSYSSHLPFQRVTHTKLVSDNAWYLGDGKLTAILGYQQNHRGEYEASFDEAELAMRLHTLNYDLRYQQPLADGWSFATGINGMAQQNANEAEELLIPDYRLFDVGLYLTANKEFDRWHLSGGVRADNRSLHTAEAFEEGKLKCEALGRRFTGITGSLGTVWHVGEQFNLRANGARGFRAPSVNELCSNGVHEGSVQYELGNSSLQSEFSSQLDLGMDYTSHFVYVTASVFSNWIDNYIFLGRLPYETEGYRTYQYRQGNARLTGGELTVDIHPVNALHIENSLSYVRGILRHTGDDDSDLPMMPAPRWSSEVRYEFPYQEHAHLQRPFLGVSMDYTFRQDHCFTLYETETATPGYALFNLSAGMDVHFSGHNCFEVFLTCQNLFDKAYQSHLSRLKYTDLGGIYGMGRNLCLKIIVPLNIPLKGED